MELTYEAYSLLGGACPDELFRRCKMEAESVLAQIQGAYNVVWNSEESKMLALVALIDEAYSTDLALQGGGQVTSIHVGSYSETRKNGGGSSAFDIMSRSEDIIRRYCVLYRKAVGVVR